MRANNDLLAQAEGTIGFFRVVFDHGGDVRYSSSRLGSGLLTAECSTRGPGYTYIAIAWPAKLAPSPSANSDHQTNVDVFLDGVIIERCIWDQKDDVWGTSCRISDAVVLTVSIIGRIRPLPSELFLMRDHPQLADF